MALASLECPCGPSGECAFTRGLAPVVPALTPCPTCGDAESARPETSVLFLTGALRNLPPA